MNHVKGVGRNSSNLFHLCIGCSLLLLLFKIFYYLLYSRNSTGVNTHFDTFKPIIGKWAVSFFYVSASLHVQGAVDDVAISMGADV